MLAIILKDGKVSIAADYWTSQTDKEFLAVTCYFLTDDFVYKKTLLGFEPLHRLYKAKYLADMVLYILD